MPGPSERLLEFQSLKHTFTVSLLQTKTYLNLNAPDDPKNANIELSIAGYHHQLKKL